jgi:hypothetical protein
MFPFTFNAISEEYRQLLVCGYEVLTCEEYYLRKLQGRLPLKCLVNRVDVDLSVKKSARLGEILTKLGIKATFFIRLHAPEYNPFSFENYRIIKELIREGHEIGYHSEVVDEAFIWDEDAEHCLRRDIEVMNRIFNYEVKGAASHGGLTGHNNLDFWKERHPSDFGLLYEAYDTQPEFNLFADSLFVSDSEWTQWKCYARGSRVEGDQRSPAQHCAEGPPLMYLLIHPDTFYDRHFYDDAR